MGWVERFGVVMAPFWGCKGAHTGAYIWTYLVIKGLIQWRCRITWIVHTRQLANDRVFQND